MKDLFVKHRSIVSSFNHLQLMVYSNSNNFISVHGGTAVLASYFGGKNIILSNPNHGLEYKFGEYSTIFPALSNAKIYHAKTRDEIFFYLNKHY